jgi:putative SOS response-associated peptidase YedK
MGAFVYARIAPSRMCYYISISVSISQIESRFNANFSYPKEFKPVYVSSAFSHPKLPVISNEEPSVISLFQWGLVPYWVKDSQTAIKIGSKTLNARSETVFEKSSFRHSILSKRCLVLVDGFYEWRHENNKTYPYYIQLQDENAFALAGIWDIWHNQSTEEFIETFSIVTTRANSLLKKIHNTKKRMPVILNKEDEKVWLAKETSREQLETLFSPYNLELKAHPVSRLIRQYGFSTEDSTVNEEYIYPELPPIE